MYNNGNSNSSSNSNTSNNSNGNGNSYGITRMDGCGLRLEAGLMASRQGPLEAYLRKHTRYIIPDVIIVPDDIVTGGNIGFRAPRFLSTIIRAS